MIDIFSALFGGVLVGGGMYVGAQIVNVVSPRAPRELRAPRIAREPRERKSIAHSPESSEQRKRQSIPVIHAIPGMPADSKHVDTDATKALGNDVVKALTTAGYTKPEASMAVAACSGAERSTIDAWLRAALKKLNMRGAVA